MSLENSVVGSEAMFEGGLTGNANTLLSWWARHSGDGAGLSRSSEGVASAFALGFLEICYLY